jgi:hypothetical protein
MNTELTTHSLIITEKGEVYIDDEIQTDVQEIRFRAAVGQLTVAMVTRYMIVKSVAVDEINDLEERVVKIHEHEHEHEHEQ